ncbi:MAG: CDP-alcohol phosphatidyltransferase family protein [Mobilitalea sp.]
MSRLIQFIPNCFSISRVGLTIIFVMNVIAQFIDKQNKLLPCILVFLLICLTDLLDGKIARKIHCTTKTGARLDVLADLFFIVISHITLINLKILPLWFLVFILLKFIEFIITSNYSMKYKYRKNNVFVFDKVGKIVAAMFFVVPGMACIFQVLTPDIASNIIDFILYSILIGGILSSYLRVKNCLKLA